MTRDLMKTGLVVRQCLRGFQHRRYLQGSFALHLLCIATCEVALLFSGSTLYANPVRPLRYNSLAGNGSRATASAQRLSQRGPGQFCKIWITHPQAAESVVDLFKELPCRDFAPPRTDICNLMPRKGKSSYYVNSSSTMHVLKRTAKKRNRHAKTS